MASSGEIISEWHASPSAAPATYERGTGQYRIPVDLLTANEIQGTVPLVLSRVQAEQMYALLSRLLYGSYAGR